MPIELRARADVAGTESPSGLSAPELSVIVPTAGRPDAIERLLRGLARQTLPADRFEVLVTDDGTQPPVAPALAALKLPFRFACEWQPRGGPGAARNRAIAKARAPFLVILNDDAGPPPDLLERHLIAQRSSKEPRAWLGGFDFAPDCTTPFSTVVTRLGLVFPYPTMRRDGPNGGNFFWTCNLSVPRQAVLDAGGFDERFDEPLCEDVELGYRLAKRGTSVHYLDGEACLHHHRIDVHWFVKRQVRLGIWMVRMWRKHGDPALLPWIMKAGLEETRFAAALEWHATARGRQMDALVREIAELDRDAAIAERVKPVNEDALRLGLLAGLRGWNVEQARQWLDALPSLTTLVFTTPGKFAPGEAARIERVRMLAGAPVEVVPLATSGASAERSLSAGLLARAAGERICFVEPGFGGDPGWLREALRSPAPALSLPGRFRLVRRDALAARPISSQAEALA